MLYHYGVCSSRKLERECHHNLSFLWLRGGLKPDHKTIAEFRRRNKSALQKVIQQCARSCIKLELIAGNVLFVDGTKMRANASIKHSWTKERAQKVLAQLDGRIRELLTECEAVDQQEQQDGSWVRLNEEWAEAQAIFRRRKEKVEHPFGHLKRNLHRGYFLLRCLAGVRAEMSLLACAFNVTRMITLLGVTELVTQLAR
jgi:Transposase domain (DUF772)/Transposase DDE domain